MTGNIFSEWMRAATMFDWTANISALVATALLALVIYGFARYVRRPRTEPIDYIGTGIWVMALDTMLRLLWGDIVPDLVPSARAWILAHASDANAIFNILVAVACWNMLKGFYILVEMRAPGQYNIFTAVFYPKRLWLGVTIRKPREPGE